MSKSLPTISVLSYVRALLVHLQFGVRQLKPNSSEIFQPGFFPQLGTMNFFVFVFLVIPATVFATDARNEYCDICENHTLCLYKGVSEDCKDSVDAGVSEEEKKYILDSHNWYRRLVAKGSESRGRNSSQPQSSNMLKMEWDDDLAKIAQHWADQCKFQHDSCRNDRRFNVGQNIYWKWRFPILKTSNWSAAMASWYEEVKMFDADIVASYTFNPETGHYTQMVWHDSKLVGCGRRSYGPNQIYVCNYGPTGNWINEPIYNEGVPCSDCPDSSECDDGLCSTAVNNELTSYASTEDLNVTDSIRILDPPSIDAIDYYSNTSSNDSESSTDDITELPIHLNIIDGLDIPDDAEILEEIEDLKKRIRNLVEKIASKRSQQ